MKLDFKRKALDQSEIDDFAAEADRLGAASHELRNEFLMSRWLPYADPPKLARGQPDPFSANYLEWVIEQWRLASGRANYTLSLESDENISANEEQLRRLYPFISADTRFIARYMMGVYFALNLLADAPNPRMVEYGVGWGNMTVAMLQAGFDVLAVDIDPKWLALLEMRARKSDIAQRLETFQGEFGSLPAGLPQLGGALFYECFHHALNHDDALSRIKRGLVDGGVIVFAAESIYKDFPQDWGVRLDGHSVWAIRRFGWMELAFSEDYMIRLTRRHGFELQRHQLQEAGPFGIVYKAVLRDAGFAMGRTILTSRETGFLEPEASESVHTRFTVGQASFDLPCGTPWVSLELKNWLPKPMPCKLLIDGELVWEGVVLAGAETNVTVAHAVDGYFRIADLFSDTFVPSDLGVNDDNRRLGIAVGRVSFHR